MPSWLARHGATEWTASRRHTGRTDLPLSPEGEVQARELGPRLDGVAFALQLSSPLVRAQETARLAGFRPKLDERLMEFDYGEYEGITTKQIHEDRPGWDLWTDGCPGGETVDDVAARMDSLIRERLAGVEGPVLLFGHGHALRILAARLLGLPPSEGRLLAMGTAQFGVLGEEHGRAVVERWGA